jgi:hypothetical protein
MSKKISPILTIFLLGSVTLPAANSAPMQKSVQADSSFKNPMVHKMRLDCASQNNLFSIQQIGVPRTQYVGQLQEKWQFPSDHLPIGMTIDGLNLASWNVLNSAHMRWIEENAQGLSRSQITQEHIYIDGTQLTIRDLRVIENIKSMLAHPTHPRSVISLQECSQALIQELKKQLPEEYGIVLSPAIPLKNQNSVIYDKRALEYDSSRSQIQKGLFSIQPNKTVMNLCFVQKEGARQTIRVINAHLPGEPGNPAPAEFAAYVTAISTPDTITIAMGDMNFNEVEMGSAFEKSIPSGMDFNLIAPYCTNIGLNLYSKSIDHFFVFTQGQHEISRSSAEEVMIGLTESVHLLDPDFFITGDECLETVHALRLR